MLQVTEQVLFGHTHKYSFNLTTLS